jgi:hypothetical protein
MKHGHLFRRVILASLVASGISGPALGGEHLRTPTTGADSSLSIARFYTASVVNVGEFPGTLIKLSCTPNESGDPGPHERQRHDYALVVAGDDVIHPLLPGTNEVRRALSSGSLQGSEVAVYGKYYPSTGVIFVSRIAVRASAMANEHVASTARTDGSTARLSSVRDARLAACASD